MFLKGAVGRWSMSSSDNLPEGYYICRLHNKKLPQIVLQRYLASTPLLDTVGSCAPSTRGVGPEMLLFELLLLLPSETFDVAALSLLQHGSCSFIPLISGSSRGQSCFRGGFWAMCLCCSWNRDWEHVCLPHSMKNSPSATRIIRCCAVKMKKNNRHQESGLPVSLPLISCFL